MQTHGAAPSFFPYLAHTLYSKKARTYCLFSAEMVEPDCLMMHFKILGKQNISVRLIAIGHIWML